MRTRLPHRLSAALAAFILLPAAAQAQVNPFPGSQGPLREDDQLQLESLARRDAADPTSPIPAAQPVAAKAIRLADGTWTVQGTRIPGSRRCGEWLVRLTNSGGQLSGVVSQARSTVPIQNLVLMPDGTFSGTTEADLRRSRHARASRVTGRFSGDSVNLTLDIQSCPTRQGSANRRAAGG